MAHSFPTRRSSDLQVADDQAGVGHAHVEATGQLGYRRRAGHAERDQCRHVALPVAAADLERSRRVTGPPANSERQFRQEGGQACDVRMNILQGPLVVKND